MGIFAKLFNKNSEEVSSRNVEDFVSLTRVYFQSVIAANLGITNIRFVPDVANFKRLFKIPTQGGRLGQAEKAASRKMLMQDYGISESFFKEIDASVKKHCRTQNHVSGILQRPDDVNGQLDAMEIPYAFHLQRRITQHDRKNST
jgi:hypothetical protein